MERLVVYDTEISVWGVCRLNSDWWRVNTDVYCIEAVLRLVARKNRGTVVGRSSFPPLLVAVAMSCDNGYWLIPRRIVIGYWITESRLVGYG